MKVLGLKGYGGRQMTLQATRKRFSPENRPQASEKERMASIPTIHFQFGWFQGGYPPGNEKTYPGSYQRGHRTQKVPGGMGYVK